MKYKLYFKAQRIVSKSSFIKRRIYSQTNVTRLKSKLSNVDWNELVKEKDPNNALGAFYKISNEKLYLYCPYNTLHQKRPSPKKPWISTSLLKSIDEKSRIYKIRMRYP